MNVSLHLSNLLIAAATFAIIGVFHPLVIKTEYYFGTKAWPVFAVVGAVLLYGSVRLDGTPGILLAIVGCSCFWSIPELFQQKKRVEKGWFPKRKTKESNHKK